MRIKMLVSLPVTVDGVHRVDCEAGEEYEVGAGIAGELVADGRAELASEDATDQPVRRGRRHAVKDAGAAEENK